jgi:RimJ/RimL family protein N-acetyltransferase
MLSFRKPTLDDMLLFFKWANDPEVRKYSYNSKPIDLENHKKWFESALKNETCVIYVFQNQYKEDVGQVRMQKQNDAEALIGISIASEHRGKGYANEMLTLAVDSFLRDNEGFLINAFIKENNLSSKKSFEKAGFQFNDMVDYENFPSFHYIKK